MDEKEYEVLFSREPPDMPGSWNEPPWRAVPALEIAFFRPEGKGHRPRTLCKLLHSPHRLHGLFKVDDRYVRCVHRGFQAEVYKDSCVELFVQPKSERGYFNFEFNCGGALLASYVTDPARVDGRVRGFTPLALEEMKEIRLCHSLPRIVDPEIRERLTWYLGFSIPFALLEAYVGQLGKIAGQVWRANLYKCGNDTSHPHWASWAPLDDRNFHAPANFGKIRFETSPDYPDRVITGPVPRSSS